MNLEALRQQLRDPKQPLQTHLGFHRVKMLLRLSRTLQHLICLEPSETMALMSLSNDGFARKTVGEESFKITEAGQIALAQYLGVE